MGWGKSEQFRDEFGHDIPDQVFAFLSRRRAEFNWPPMDDHLGRNDSARWLDAAQGNRVRCAITARAWWNLFNDDFDVLKFGDRHQYPFDCREYHFVEGDGPTT